MRFKLTPAINLKVVNSVPSIDKFGLEQLQTLRLILNITLESRSENLTKVGGPIALGHKTI